MTEDTESREMVQSSIGSTVPDKLVSVESSDIQREILQEVERIIKDPRCAEIQYPNEYGWKILQDKADPDYEHGAKIRFAALKQKVGFLGKDETCVAIVDNSQTQRRRTLGRGIIQAMQSHKSNREIAISRFVQTPGEFATGTGTYIRLVLSDTIQDATGTFVSKSRASRVLPKAPLEASRPPNFAKRWSEGGAQLSPAEIYDVSGDHLEATGQDLKDILQALRNGSFDQGMTQKVYAYEVKSELAQTATKQTPELRDSSQSHLLE